MVYNMQSKDPKITEFEVARQGLWLIHDILTDLLERHPGEPEVVTLLLKVRGAVVDMLSDFRRMEQTRARALGLRNG